MATYLYPTAREMRALGAELVSQLTLNDPLLGRVFPITTVNSPMLQWSVDADGYGLQQLRGLDGAPLHVTRIGATNYVSEPGYFGEFETIGERELTLRAGSFAGEGTVDVTDLVVQCQRQLTERRIRRIRQIGWTLLTTGTFSVTGKGSTLTYTDTFTLQTSAGSAWGTAASGTPLSDLRTVQALGSQYGVNFGSSAVAIMNRVTANKMLQNSNAADLGGRRTTGGGTVNSLDNVNRITLGEDLPTIVIYDDGYKNDSGTFTKFIPNDKTVVLGTRNDGDRIGEWRMTRNMVNPNGAPGVYEFVKDYIRGINAPKEVPPKIEVHAGMNGGPVIFRPNAIVILTTT
jgi:hypothetical protein